MWTCWIRAALAQQPAVPPEPAAAAPAEEIIVWGDPFRRWDHRWHVETELRFGEPFRLLADNNLESRLTNLQIRVVLDCDRDVVLGPKREEVRCTIEDLSLVAMTSRPGADDLRVLQEADAAMTGAQLQLQVSANGGVPNVGLEGFTPQNERDRRREEQYRQLLSRIILPFHLGLPPIVADGVKWYEYNSRLMTMPSPFASGGSTELAHFMDVFEGKLLVQTIGDGVVLPVVGVETLGGPGLPVDMYKMELHGVAIFDIDTGIMSERLWAFGGELTASSPNLLRGLKYGHRGHLKLLGSADGPDLGPTVMAKATADAKGEGPVWEALAIAVD